MAWWLVASCVFVLPDRPCVVGEHKSLFGAAAALAAAVATGSPGAHDQTCKNLSAMGVSHWHQLLAPQAHSLLCGCVGVCSLAGMRFLPGCSAGGLTCEYSYKTQTHCDVMLCQMCLQLAACQHLVKSISGCLGRVIYVSHHMSTCLMHINTVLMAGM